MSQTHDQAQATNPPPMSPPAPPAQRAPTTPTVREPKPSRLPPLDWAATHGPVTGALSVTTGAGALAMFGAASGMPATVPLAIGAAGAIGHGIGHSLHRRLTGQSILTRAGTWLLAGSWAGWAIGYGPLSWAAVGSLAGIGVGISAMASHAAIHEEAVEEEQLLAAARAQDRELNRARTAIAIEWEQRIKAVTGVAVYVFAVEVWENGNGFTLAADLPDTATWDRVKAGAAGLAAAARLPLGCTIHVEEGDVQGRVVLDIPTRNTMDQIHDYPEDYSPLSILTGLLWGLTPIGDPIRVFLREACALILGPPGSGKSTFLDVVLAGFARCPDVLTWVIDLKAGAIGIPWVRPWLEAQGHRPTSPGNTPPPPDVRPGVDWLASTPAEALLMMQVALLINAARQLEYQNLLDEQDVTMLPVSARIPQIEIVIDEGAELLSAASFQDRTMRDLQEAVRKAMRTTRAMGIRLILTAVDGNVSALGDTSVHKFSPVGVALTSGESSGSNWAKLFPGARMDTRQLTAKGAGVIGSAGADGFPATAFKGWRTKPSTTRTAVLATNQVRGTLDPVSTRAAGNAYAERWSPQRAGWLWAHTGGISTSNTGSTGPAGPGTTPRPLAGLNLSYMRHQDPDPAPGSDADADVLAAQMMRDLEAWRAAESGTTDEPPTTHRPIQGLRLSYMDNQPGNRPPIPLLLTRALAAFDGESIHTETLAATLRTTPEVLGRLLPMLGITAHKNPITISGKQARGYKRETFQDAADRLTRGDQIAPDDVHTWRPNPT